MSNKTVFKTPVIVSEAKIHYDQLICYTLKYFSLYFAPVSQSPFTSDTGIFLQPLLYFKTYSLHIAYVCSSACEEHAIYHNLSELALREHKILHLQVKYTEISSCDM